MAKRLYCGNLSFNVNSSDLEQLFAQFGTVLGIARRALRRFFEYLHGLCLLAVTGRYHATEEPGIGERGVLPEDIQAEFVHLAKVAELHRPLGGPV